MVEFRDQLFALTETPVINEVTHDSLRVKRKILMSEYIAGYPGGSSAHPHILEDGTMILFRMDMRYTRSYNFISIPPQPASPDLSPGPFTGAKIVATAPSRWKLNLSYTHSFGLTDNYFVHLEQPLTYNLPRMVAMAVTGSTVADCLTSYPGQSNKRTISIISCSSESLASLALFPCASRKKELFQSIEVKMEDILVIERSSGKRTAITYKAPNGFVFHFINCYEESDQIVCDTSFYPNGSDFIKSTYLEHLAQRPMEHFSANYKVHFARFVLPLQLKGAGEGENLVKLPYTTATAVLAKGSQTTVCITPEIFEGNHGAELPRINYAYNGKKYRYFYGSSAFAQSKSQLSKYDLTKKRVLTFEVEDNITPGEPVFLARPGAKQEDDGKRH
ncbi:beta,beta-carotene 15,15'-monooxygenase [Plakobranchus ocellatus]|uniref:Beta,beta-carotene 15,15'-monooxygenase n=1 Tax=Plakobranchus ocellatus TaxID=259542 RepID=A0AAV4AYP0_9GAST|nr:beta,beta-carotene 15,15'-monooxygenase [Plakobranchus ocellatus]